MPIFELQTPDGRTFEVDAPDMESASSALSGKLGRADDAGAAFLQGASLGFGDEIVAGGSAALRSIYDPRSKEFFSGDFSGKYAEDLTAERNDIESTRGAHPYASAALETAGGVAGSLVPVGAAMRGATSLGGAALRGLTTGAGLGAAQGFGSSEGGLENRLGGAKTGAAIGAGVGLAAPYATAGIGRLLRPVVTSPERAQMAQTLANEGVDLTAGQRSGNNALRYAESELGGQAASNTLERQGEQFTSAALGRAGIQADRATSDVMDDAFDRIGQQFDGLSNRNMLMPDQQLVNDLAGIQSQYASLVPQTARASVVDDVINDVMQTVSLHGPNGTPAIQGQSYQALSSWLAAQARKTTNPELSQALYGIREAMDEAMERSIAQTNPRDLGAWREARRLYRNMLVLEQAATGAGENAALGLISPSQLRNATVQKQGRRNYARGRGDFAELARAGEALMKPLPNSGTAPRMASRIPAIMGGIGGTLAGGLDAGLLAAGAAMAGPALAGRALMSRPVQAYLSRQGGRLSPRARANMSSALIGGGSTGLGLLNSP